MRKLFAVLSTSLIALGLAAGAASAQPACDGDFALVDGNWIATRYCQRAVAQKVAAEQHMRISASPVGAHEETASQFCQQNSDDIRTSTYCNSYIR
jgi:hypothetical protein